MNWLLKEICSRIARMHRLSCLIILVSTTSFINADLPSFIATNDVLGIDDLYDPDTDLSLMTEDLSTAPKRSPAQDIINLLLAVDAVDLLNEDLFLRTNPLNSRSLLDLPIFELHSCCLFSNCQPCNYPFNWITNCHLFLNKTHRSNFTRDSTNLSSYLALDEPTLIQKLETTVAHFKDLFSAQELDVATLFCLFKNMTVEERRAGFMFELLHRWEAFELRFWLPFYYLERNYILEPDEIQAIEQQFGSEGNAPQDQFQKQHLISDKVGFGDSRIEISYRIFDEPLYLVRLGAYSTLPSAGALRKGMLGSSFRRPATLPLLDLEALFDLAQNITLQNEALAFNTIKNYLLNSLDRLSANLLDSPLGNGGHMTIAGVIRTETLLCYFLPWRWAEKIKMQSRLSLEYLFPHFESRAYIERNTFDEFDRQNLMNMGMADENLLFIEQELSKKFYLLFLDTRIQPGPIFRWGSNFCYRGACFDISAGTDMWLQFKEIRHRINTFQQTRQLIDTEAARKPFAYQSKLIGGIGYRADHPDYEVAFSLNLDYTYANSGIGQDWTASLNIEALF